MDNPDACLRVLWKASRIRSLFPHSLRSFSQSLASLVLANGLCSVCLMLYGLYGFVSHLVCIQLEFLCALQTTPLYTAHTDDTRNLLSMHNSFNATDGFESRQ